jgi:hypothetical protein
MNIEMPSRYNASESESKWYQAWDSNNLFQPDSDETKPTYTITIPPPNITDSKANEYSFFQDKTTQVSLPKASSKNNLKSKEPQEPNSDEKSLSKKFGNGEKNPVAKSLINSKPSDAPSTGHDFALHWTHPMPKPCSKFLLTGTNEGSFIED